MKPCFFSLVFSFVLVVVGISISEASIEIALDSTTIPQAMAATGSIEVRTSNSQNLVLGRGVQVLRGEVLAEDIEFGQLLAKVSIVSRLAAFRQSRIPQLKWAQKR